MLWKNPLTKLKTLVDANKMWWEGEAQEHKCIRQSGCPNHIAMAYAINQDMKEIEKREKSKIEIMRQINRLSNKIFNTCHKLEPIGYAKEIRELTDNFFKIDEKGNDEKPVEGGE